MRNVPFRACLKIAAKTYTFWSVGKLIWQHISNAYNHITIVTPSVRRKVFPPKTGDVAIDKTNASTAKHPPFKNRV